MNMDARRPWPFAPTPALVEKSRTDVEAVADEDIEQVEPEAEKIATAQRRKMTDADIRMVADLHAQGLSAKEIAQRMGRPYATVCKAVARIKNGAVLSEPEQAPACVAGAEVIMPLAHNQQGCWWMVTRMFWRIF